ncbi:MULTISPECIES: diguanylate cyclase [Xanthobacter]|uniref:diguanylate cyclase n=1 Tax=Xanthobacter TaxID=279 RepID=UPI001F2C402B|nr:MULTISPECIES: diguanylate cyclase [unclassified Xanthobacter]
MQIVLVDSSRVSLKLISQTLAQAGHEVVTFSDGATALEYLRSGYPLDVLLTSFELPHISGLELCWEARLIANEGRPLYVIAMSSNADGHQLIEALDSGADDFVAKPPVPAELFARLRAAERLNQARRELIRLATVDPLTELLNRRAFFERAQNICSAATAEKPVSLVMFDIDHFKRINDSRGHDAGDCVLRAVSALVRQGPGQAARLGGEEFVVILPATAAPQAWAMAEVLRTKVAGMQVPVPSGGPVSVTISLGLAQYRTGETVDQFLKAADVALYAAKTEGRNRTAVAHASSVLHLPDGAGYEPPGPLNHPA